MRMGRSPDFLFLKTRVPRSKTKPASPSSLRNNRRRKQPSSTTSIPPSSPFLHLFLSHNLPSVFSFRSPFCSQLLSFSSSACLSLKSFFLLCPHHSFFPCVFYDIILSIFSLLHFLCLNLLLSFIIFLPSSGCICTVCVCI